VDSIDILRAELESVMPEAKVIQLRGIAQAREKQRLMVEKYFSFAMYVVVTGCALWIGVLAMLNVRERRQEIGVFHALGYGMPHIASLFLGKAVALGLIGALIGFAVGTGLSLWLGPGIFEVTASMIQPDYALLGWSMLLAPMFAALCSMIPTAIAVSEDPADILRVE
jgi:ABC-type antimicrobial peptide transport system permease subunit